MIAPASMLSSWTSAVWWSKACAVADKTTAMPWSAFMANAISDDGKENKGDFFRKNNKIFPLSLSLSPARFAFGRWWYHHSYLPSVFLAMMKRAHLLPGRSRQNSDDPLLSYEFLPHEMMKISGIIYICQVHVERFALQVRSCNCVLA